MEGYDGDVILFTHNVAKIGNRLPWQQLIFSFAVDSEMIIHERRIKSFQLILILEGQVLIFMLQV